MSIRHLLSWLFTKQNEPHEEAFNAAAIARGFDIIPVQLRI